MSRKKVQLNGHTVGAGEGVYIIAEGGVTNWGELDLAKKQVDAALKAGCDAVKFQAQTTEALVSKKVSPEWYERMKYKELSYKELAELWQYCKDKGIQCGITAHTDVDLDFLDKELNVPYFKIGSGESINHRFLKNVGSRKKPVIMSLGLHENIDEIKEAVHILEDAGTKDIILLHCNTIYPTPPSQNYLHRITELKEVFDYPIGYSDHSVGFHIPLAAIALGAKLIEKHVSFDLTDERSLDSAGSCTPEMLTDMVSNIWDVEKALSEPGIERKQAIQKGRDWARQSIVASQDISQGDIITQEMIAFKRPGKGLAPNEANKFINKKAKKQIQEDDLILESDVE